MKEAQRFLTDFDGIVAGAPGLDWTGRAASALRMEAHIMSDPLSQLKQPDRELLYKEAVNFCDAGDGVQDLLIGRPNQCAFDPAVLQCDAEKTGACLTKAQIETARMMYSSPLILALVEKLPGYSQEVNWAGLIWDGQLLLGPLALSSSDTLYMRTKVGPVDQFLFEFAIAAGERKDDDTVNALSPDLFEFIEGGGKLLASSRMG